MKQKQGAIRVHSAHGYVFCSRKPDVSLSQSISQSVTDWKVRQSVSQSLTENSVSQSFGFNVSKSQDVRDQWQDSLVRVTTEHNVARVYWVQLTWCFTQPWITGPTGSAYCRKLLVLYAALRSEFQLSLLTVDFKEQLTSVSSTITGQQLHCMHGLRHFLSFLRFMIWFQSSRYGPPQIESVKQKQ